jgi:hypothetical protein
MPLIPALGRWRQEEHVIKANLGYIASAVRPVSKNIYIFVVKDYGQGKDWVS